MLHKNKNERIGAQNGISEILAHPYFKDIDFEQLLNKKLDPPYVPNLENESFFDPELKPDEIEFSNIGALGQKIIAKQEPGIFADF